MITGRELQALRKARGYPSAQKLALVSGVSRETLAQFESEHRSTLSVEQLIGLCSALSVSVFTLVPEFAAVDPDLGTLREEVRASLIQDLQRLP